jgi:signal transduction histidine kinase
VNDLLAYLLRIGGLPADDLDGLRRARLYVSIALVIGGATVAYLLIAILDGNLFRATVCLLILIALLPFSLLAKHGALDAAERMLAIAVPTVSLGLIAVLGVNSGRLGGLLIGAFLLGMLRRPLPALAFHAALMAAAILCAVRLEQAGILPLAPAREPLWWSLLLQIGAAATLMIVFNSGYVRLSNDVAEHQRKLALAQTGLVDARALLEAAVASRSAALEQASRDLEQFGTSAAHDLLAPMHRISQNLELAARGGGSATPREVFEAIELAQLLAKRAERMLRAAMREPQAAPVSR